MALLALPIVLLCSCGKNSVSIKRTKVNLTSENYANYIAVYTISDSYSSSTYTYTKYRYHLVGSSLCKFNNCSLTYQFAYKDGAVSEDMYTVKLTISGCGESVEVNTSSRTATAYIFTVTSASGIVEILY